MGAARSTIGRSVPSRAMRRVWIRQPHHHALAQNALYRARYRGPGGLVDDAEDLSHRPTTCLSLGPARKSFGNRIEVLGAAKPVHGDDRVADAVEGRPRDRMSLLLFDRQREDLAEIVCPPLPRNRDGSSQHRRHGKQRQGAGHPRTVAGPS